MDYFWWLQGLYLFRQLCPICTGIFITFHGSYDVSGFTSIEIHDNPEGTSGLMTKCMLIGL